MNAAAAIARRLRAPAAQPTVRDREPMARALSLLLFAGAAMALTTPLVPHEEQVDEVAHIGLGLGALLAGVVIRRSGSWLPVIAFQAFAAFGTLLITASIYSTSQTASEAPENLLLYLWPILYAGYFFSRAATAAQLALVAASYGGLLIATGSGEEATSAWVTVTGTMAAAAVFVRLLRERLDRDLSQQRATLESTTDGILVVNQQNEWMSFNRKFIEMWRIPDEIRQSRDDDAAVAFVLDQLAEPGAFVAKIRELYDQPEAESFDELTFKDGRVFERYSQPQLIDGRSVGRVWSFRDVTERKRSEERLKHLAEHDPLTDLLNRRRFEDELARESERSARYRSGGAVLLMDLDDFKRVNDTYGHVWGDEVLRGVARMLLSRVRSTDVVARLGGDEFAILIPEADEVRAVKLAEELLEVLRGYSLDTGTGTIGVATSIGVVTLDAVSHDGSEPLIAADTAMYRAKAEGGDRLAVYEPGRDRSGPRPG
jgi:diguanylate cyclase (GGDEF)-like protein